MTRHPTHAPDNRAPGCCLLVLGSLGLGFLVGWALSKVLL